MAPTYHGQVDVPKDVVAVANVDEDDREHHSDPHDGVDWESKATGGGVGGVPFFSVVRQEPEARDLLSAITL